MITSVILTYDDLADPIECEDLFSYEGSVDPSTLNTFEAKVDTREMTLSLLGDMFPNLKKLRLNNSIIPSVRDIGSTLVSLRFLSLARCTISSLDGVSTISRNLEELYLAFNHITDVCDLMGMEKLRVVDLEGNQLPDISAIEILSLCPGLKALTLTGNPAADIPDYRDRVKGLLPQLAYLDEKRLVPKRKMPPPIPETSEPIVTIERPGIAMEAAKPEDDEAEHSIMTEFIDDIVADRPPTSRAYFHASDFPELMTPARRMKQFGVGPQKFVTARQRRVVRPMSAKGRLF
jgi:hypothetical protein